MRFDFDAPLDRAGSLYETFVAPIFLAAEAFFAIGYQVRLINPVPPVLSGFAGEWLR